MHCQCFFLWARKKVSGKAIFWLFLVFWRGKILRLCFSVFFTIFAINCLLGLSFSIFFRKKPLQGQYFLNFPTHIFWWRGVFKFFSCKEPFFRSWCFQKKKSPAKMIFTITYGGVFRFFKGVFYCTGILLFSKGKN